MYIKKGVFQHLTGWEFRFPICKILNSLKIGGEILPSPNIHLFPIFYAFRMTVYDFLFFLSSQLFYSCKGNFLLYLAILLFFLTGQLCPCGRGKNFKLSSSET